MTPRDAIVGGLVPLAIASGGVVLAWRPWRGAPAPRPGWGASLGLGVGVSVAYCLIESRIPTVPPQLSSDWIPIAMLVGAGLGVVLSLWRAPGWVAWFARAVACVALVPIIIDMLPSPPWESPDEAGLHVVGLAAMGLVVWWSVDRLGDRLPGPTVPFALLLTATASAGAMLLLALTARIAQHAGSIAAGCAGIALLGLWRRDLALARGVAGPFALGMGVIWLVAHFFTYGSNALVAVLCFLAPAGAWAGGLPFVRRGSPWKRHVLSLVGVLIVLGVALGIAAAIGLGGEESDLGY